MKTLERALVGVWERYVSTMCAVAVVPADAQRFAACRSVRSLLALVRATGGARSRRLPDRGFQRVREASGDVETCLRRDFDETGRTRHVDLGQKIADDIEPHDQMSLLP